MTIHYIKTYVFPSRPFLKIASQTHLEIQYILSWSFQVAGDPKRVAYCISLSRGHLHDWHDLPNVQLILVLGINQISFNDIAEDV